ncbi:MAG: SDR family NAD(P)-dependent oxidoreductase [Fimbriimonadaceae bacterium]|nr:SDR family NAD(P)-dependent oxidoreductase [Fimbriimonadaceae bacterium]
MDSTKKVIVVGASSGIGAELVKLLAEQGATVAAVARRKDRLDELAKSYDGKVLAFAHDVTHYDEIPALFQEITKQLGGLDMIIYASGVMPEVAWHEYDFAKDQAMIDVNLTGAVAWLNQAAIRFENTKSGTIVAIGSVAGERGRAGQPVYNMTKAALKAYMEALRNRLTRYGVKVVTIKPGPTETEMTAALHLKGAMTARRAAELILRKSRKSGEHYLKFSHKVIFAIIRNFPSSIFHKLKV